jgi:hypothetical protein
MPYDELDDEDWYDDEDELDDDSVACPECGQAVPGISDHCPTCGYWVTDADRDAASVGSTKRRWLVVTAWIVLAVFIVPLLALILTVLKRGSSIAE